MNYLLDPSWLGAVAAFIGVLLAVFFYFASKTKKSLSYEILSESSLISIDNEIKGKLKILWDDKPVENVHLLLVRIANDGKLPITANDYERPIALRFKDSSNIISAELTSSTPTLIAKATIHDKLVVLDPVLMNAGDYFTIKVLVGEYDGLVDLDTRIVGVKSIRKARNQRITARQSALIASSIAVILVTSSFWLIKALRTPSTSPPKILGITAEKRSLKPGEETNILAEVDGDGALRFQWFTSPGTIEGSGPVVRYRASSSPRYSEEFIYIWLYVTDRWGRQTSQSTFAGVVQSPTETSVIAPKSKSQKKPPRLALK